MAGLSMAEHKTNNRPKRYLDSVRFWRYTLPRPMNGIIPFMAET